MADDADLAAIRAFAAGGGKFTVDREGNIVAPIDATGPTPDAAPADAQPDAAPNETPGERANDARDQRQADARQRQPQRPARKPVTRGPLRGMVNWIENVPTPGGNLALVLILIFFAFAIIPVNSGKTRLQLIWAVLTGNATLEASGQNGASSVGAIAASAGTSLAAGVATAVGAPVLAVPGVLPTIASGVGTAIGFPDIGNLLEPPRG